MGLLFSLRGDSLTPRYAMGGKAYNTFVGGGTLASPPAPVSLAHASCFGGYAIAITKTPDDYKELFYNAKGNWVRNSKVFSMRVRAAPNYTGTPPQDVQILGLSQFHQHTAYGGARLVWQDNNTLRIQCQPKNGLANLFLNTTPTLSLASGVFKDYMLTSDGTNWYCSIEGVQVATGSVENAADANYNLDWNLVQIILGQYPFNGWINEVNLWDTCEPHVYTARTAWLTCDDFDGSLYENVAASQLISGVTKKQAGVDVVGSVIAAAKATTKIGVTANDGTGEYAATERYTDLDESLVARGEDYKYNSTTNNRTGELDNVTNTIAESVAYGQTDSAILVETE